MIYLRNIACGLESSGSRIRAKAGRGQKSSAWLLCILLSLCKRPKEGICAPQHSKYWFLVLGTATSCRSKERVGSRCRESWQMVVFQLYAARFLDCSVRCRHANKIQDRKTFREMQRCYRNTRTIPPVHYPNFHRELVGPGARSLMTSNLTTKEKLITEQKFRFSPLTCFRICCSAEVVLNAEDRWGW